MGRVYEALNKSQREQAQAAATAVGVERAEVRREPHHEESSDEFDFVHYSLSTPSAAEIERIQDQVSSAARDRQNLTKPSREVEISVSRIDPHLVTFYDCDPRAADEYKKLAGMLIAGAGNREMKRLLIASAEHGDGRTCVTLNLACALARAKRRVLVVDTDMQRPAITRMLGIEAEVSAADVVAQGLAPGTAAIKVLPAGFVVLPGRERSDNPAELLASPSFRELLNSFAPDYDFILFDSSPLIGSNDSSLLLPLVNGTLMVIRSGKTTSSQLGKAIGPLSPEQIVGVVLNRAA